MIVSPAAAIASDTRLEQRSLSGNDGHLAGELVCFTDRESLIVLAGLLIDTLPSIAMKRAHRVARVHRELHQLVPTVIGQRTECGLFVPDSNWSPANRAISKGRQATPLHLYVNCLGAQNRNSSANINM
jgi:hypothetical protein